MVDRVLDSPAETCIQDVKKGVHPLGVCTDSWDWRAYLVLGVLNRHALEVADTHLALVETELVRLGLGESEPVLVVLGCYLVLLAGYNGSHVRYLTVTGQRDGGGAGEGRGKRVEYKRDDACGNISSPREGFPQEHCPSGRGSR